MKSFTVIAKSGEEARSNFNYWNDNRVIVKIRRVGKTKYRNYYRIWYKNREQDVQNRLFR